MKKIRKLTGKKAQEYHDKLESQNVLIKINVFSLLLAELRARFMEYMKFDLKYFHQRHRYSPEHRRVLDLFVISAHDKEMDVRLNQTGMIMDLRIKYLKYLYRKELNQKHKWIRVTASSETDQIYVWHEDVEEYHKQLNVN